VESPSRGGLRIGFPQRRHECLNVWRQRQRKIPLLRLRLEALIVAIATWVFPIFWPFVI
jgi:hypothetical protein